MLRRALLILSLLLAGLIGTYLVLSQTTKFEIDKNVTVAAPTSPKSAPEFYAFGYDPDVTYTETRTPCRVQYPTKHAMWGDLHIHTALSADAFPDGTRTYPEDVYAFAQGAEIPIPTPEGTAQRTLQLDRPLDFAAVTDHADACGFTARRH